MQQKDRVIFRKWKKNANEYIEDGEVIAFLPDVPATPGYVMSYMHIGQHGEADYYYCLSVTVPATPEEYQDLLEELQSIGYDLIVRQKIELSPRRTGWLSD